MQNESSKDHDFLLLAATIVLVLSVGFLLAYIIYERLVSKMSLETTNYQVFLRSSGLGNETVSAIEKTLSEILGIDLTQYEVSEDMFEIGMGSQNTRMYIQLGS